MRGVGDKKPLRLHGRDKLVEQGIERAHQRLDFQWHVAVQRHRRQAIRITRTDRRGQHLQRA